MTNLSSRTRKQQVLDYLWDRRNSWVDGPLLATEEVGGSEGLRRLRELRIEGEHDIRERRHPDPDRDIWQYKLVQPEHSAPTPKPLDLDFEDAKPAYANPATEVARREEEAARLLDLPEPEPAPSAWPADHGQTRMSSAVKRKEDGTFEYVPPQRTLGEQLTIPADPPQPAGNVFDHRPAKIDWGAMALCPSCKGKIGKEPLLGDDGKPVTKHKRRKAPCPRCNGYGIVPNIGPIPLTMPDD